MKRVIWLMVFVLTGGVVLSQQAPVTVRPATAAAAGGMQHGATNNAPWMELRDIQAKLRPIEDALVKSDAEIQALLQQRKDAEQFLQDLDKKRRDLMAAKLLANPEAAPLVRRRAELLAKAQELRGAGGTVAPATAELSGRTGASPNATNFCAGR